MKLIMLMYRIFIFVWILNINKLILMHFSNHFLHREVEGCLCISLLNLWVRDRLQLPGKVSL
jgi:hypothetical protein